MNSPVIATSSPSLHHQFVAWGEAGIKALGQANAVIYDVKGILPLGAADGRL